jgi:uncharacterized protein YegP (UPF0339 family)
MKIKIYKDGRQQYRWSAIDGNGRIICDGSEGYDSERNVLRALENVMDEFRGEIKHERMGKTIRASALERV